MYIALQMEDLKNSWNTPSGTFLKMNLPERQNSGSAKLSLKFHQERKSKTNLCSDMENIEPNKTGPQSLPSKINILDKKRKEETTKQMNFSMIDLSMGLAERLQRKARKEKQIQAEETEKKNICRKLEYSKAIDQKNSVNFPNCDMSVPLQKCSVEGEHSSLSSKSETNDAVSRDNSKASLNEICEQMSGLVLTKNNTSSCNSSKGSVNTSDSSQNNQTTFFNATRYSSSPSILDKAMLTIVVSDEESSSMERPKSLSNEKRLNGLLLTPSTKLNCSGVFSSSELNNGFYSPPSSSAKPPHSNSRLTSSDFKYISHRQRNIFGNRQNSIDKEEDSSKIFSSENKENHETILSNKLRIKTETPGSLNLKTPCRSHSKDEKKSPENSITKSSEWSQKRKAFINLISSSSASSDDSLTELKESTDSKQHTVNSRVIIVSSDESCDEEFNNFLKNLQTPKKQLNYNSSSDSSFITDDDSATDNDDEGFHLRVTSILEQTTQETRRKTLLIQRSINDEWKKIEAPQTPLFTPNVKIQQDKKVITSKKNVRSTTKKTMALSSETSTSKKIPPSSLPKASFLMSLSSDLPEERRHSDAVVFLQAFNKNRDKLIQILFLLYNEQVFDNKLPSDMKITWNARMTKTAGFCYYRRDPSIPLGRSARIELSSKVLDSAERVRDTLIHEMCHAASWLINGRRDGHGPIWHYWVQRANLKLPDLPPISRCHTYAINTKYVYRCSTCGYRIGRHSKSLNVKKKLCGLCHGTFELLKSGKTVEPVTPRTPGKFALFVKDNYKTVRSSDKNLKHADVMKILSAQFSEKAKIA